MKKVLFGFVFFIMLATVSLPLWANEDNSGRIGIQMYKFKKPRIAKSAVVIGVFPDSPAWLAGIRMADQVLKVNDVDVSKMSVPEIQNLLTGKVGTSVNLTLLTREGVRSYTLKRAELNLESATIPRWYQFCGHPKTEGEICYIHPGQYKMRASDWVKIMGPYGVNYYGTQLAAQRYQFEDDLRLCQESKDKAMCYLEIRKTIQNNAIAQQSVQLQKAMLLNQTLNGLNNNLNMQMINQNMNYNFNNLNNNLFNINNNLQMLRY